MLQIQLRGETVTLLAERGLLWKDVLIVADMHWGKTAHFRKNGIAIPATAQHGDEMRLAELIREHNVQRLVVAGDMFHSKANGETDNFAHWRKAHPDLHIDLVIGNHDVLPKQHYGNWQIHLHENTLDLGPFVISHDEADCGEKFCIHGHLHPSFTIRQQRHNSIKLHCYCTDGSRMILPAFGKFTGTYKIQSADFDHIYLIADNEVIQWQ